MSKIIIDNLDITYYMGGRHAVKSASLTLEKGKVIGLVGESGSGKSTILMSIPRLLPAGAQISGNIRLCSENTEIDLLKISDNELRSVRWKKIAIVPQGAMNSFTPTMTIASHIKEVLKVHIGMKGDEAYEKIKSLLIASGLDPKLACSYPHELSGGQKQRAAIATALACGPDFLLADEPTTALDVITQSEVLNTLARLVRERGMGMLLVTHDLPMASRICEKLYVMRGGEILCGQKEREYKDLLIGCSKLENPPVPFPYKPTEKEYGKSFEAEDLSVNFGKHQEIKVLKHVSLSLESGGKTLSVVGETGSGKTTLLRSMLGLVKTDGVLSLFGCRINGVSDKEKIELRRRCGYVPQDPYGSLPPTLTVLQSVLEPWLIVGKGTVSKGEARAKELLDELKLDSSLWNSRVKYALSGGQRQRVCIARALILEPELLLCDEPTAMQDVSTRGDILSVFERRVAKGMSLIFVTHDLFLARYASEDCVVLWRGEIVERLKSIDIMTAARHEYTKSLIKALTN